MCGKGRIRRESVLWVSGRFEGCSGHHLLVFWRGIEFDDVFVCAVWIVYCGSTDGNVLALVVTVYTGNTYP